jgi:hypothetical protein
MVNKYWKGKQLFTTIVNTKCNVLKGIHIVAETFVNFQHDLIITQHFDNDVLVRLWF